MCVCFLVIFLPLNDLSDLDDFSCVIMGLPGWFLAMLHSEDGAVFEIHTSHIRLNYEPQQHLAGFLVLF